MDKSKGKIVAIWGSPNSGKTTFATKLATAIYDSYRSTVIVLYCNLETPVLPIIFPNMKHEDVGSVGIPLAKVDIENEDVIANLVTVKERQNFGFLGYRGGENKYTYPKYGRGKAEDLLDVLCKLADYVVVDCISDIESSILSSVSMEKADQIIRLSSPDLKSVSYNLSQMPLYSDGKYRLESHIMGLNVPEADVYMPVEEVKSHLKDIAFTVPFSRQVKVQMQAGKLYEQTKDKAFDNRLKAIAKRVVEYETK